MEKQLLRTIIILSISHWCTSYITIASTSPAPTSDEDKRVPYITPNQMDVTALPGQNYTFTCRSPLPITWKFDDSIKSAYTEGNKADFSPIITHITIGEGAYQSNIELRKIDYTFVGYYYCVKNSSKDYEYSYLLQTSQAARIYLFVEDVHHPIVLSNKFILTDDPSYVIPCKPTSRKSKVQLINTEERDGEQQTFEYNMYEGFKPNFTSTKIVNFETYICKADTPERKLVAINSRTLTHALIPQITSITDNYGIIGTRLELTCTVISEMLLHNLNVTWTTPTVDIAQKENRAEVEKTWEKKGNLLHYINKLSINDFNGTKDVGLYRCNVGAGSSHINSTEFSVERAYHAKEMFIKTQTDSKDPSLVLKGGEVEWLVEVLGNPQPTVVWLDNHGKKIPWSKTEDKTRKFTATQENRSTKLKIRNVSSNDLGSYTLYADNGRLKKQEKFRLLVEETPKIGMATVRVKPGEKAKVSCDVAGYPYSFVYFTFSPCSSEIKCDNFGPPLDWLQQNETKQTALLQFVPKSSGIVTCFARNTLGTEKTFAPLLVSDIDDDLIIWTENKRPLGDGRYQDSLTCAGSVYKYRSRVSLFKDGKLLKTSTDGRVTINDTQYSYQNELSWLTGLQTPSGRYICKGERLSDGKIDEKTFWIKRAPAAEPVSEIQIGKPFEFRCEIGSEDAIKVRWYKDDTEIDVTNSIDADIEFLGSGTTLSIKSVKAENEGRYECIAENRLGEVHVQKWLYVTSK